MIPQFSDPNKCYALTVWKHFHTSSHSHSKKIFRAKSTITTKYRILMSKINTEFCKVTNNSSTIQAILHEWHRLFTYCVKQRNSITAQSQNDSSVERLGDEARALHKFNNIAINSELWTPQVFRFSRFMPRCTSNTLGLGSIKWHAKISSIWLTNWQHMPYS